MMLNKNLQEINIQNMDTELVAQMFKNYQSNVLFHLEGKCLTVLNSTMAADYNSYQRPQRPCVETEVAGKTKPGSLSRAEQGDGHGVHGRFSQSKSKPKLF
jgi:hypothetical protein